MVFMDVKNWHTFAKRYSSDRDQFVITFNLRNHGGNEFKKEQTLFIDGRRCYGNNKIFSVRVDLLAIQWEEN